MRYWILGIIWLSACSMLSSPDPVPQGWEYIVETEWGIAVAKLEKAGVPTNRLSTVQWHDFSWKQSQGPVDCGGDLAYACYRHRGFDHETIEWWVEYPQALRHEIGHGILDKLGYSCWSDWEHQDKDGKPRNGGCPR